MSNRASQWAVAIVAAASFAAVTHQARATTFGDSSGDTFFGGILDITSVEVTDTATDLIFKINLAGDPVATDWGKYMIGIDSAPGGDTTSDGWARPIIMSSGMDWWIGTWVDGGNGGEIRYPSWPLQSATYGSNPDGLTITKDSSSVTVQFAYAGLGLAPGSTFCFDVYTSGGGGSDSAVDALANPSQSIANWGDPYDSGTLMDYYTITAIPEPGTFALVGLGGLALVAGLRRRRS